MTHTHFREIRNEVVPHRASAYSGAAGAWRISLPNYEHYGSTNLVTTVGDLLKWKRNLLEARVGGAQVIRGMLVSGRLDDGTSIGYGGGLFLREWRGLQTVAHDGADAGYRADGLLFPAQRLAIVALCNAADIAPDVLTRKVAEAYLGDRLREGLKSAVPLAERAQCPLAGTYWSAATDEVIRLEFKDGALRQLGGAASLVPIGGGTFRAGDTTREWAFQQRGPDATELRIVDFWPTSRLFERIDDPTPDAGALATMSGRYRSDDTRTEYTVALTDGQLTLKWPRYPAATLTPIGGDRFVGPQSWTVSFTRNADGAVDGLTISSRRLRRLRAERIEPSQTEMHALADR